jgi:tetratricopeptide (TPR) repeat protein
MSELIMTKTEKGTATCAHDGYALLELARGWLKQGNAVVALELLDSAIQAREVESDVELRAKVLKETARAKMMQSDWDDADSQYLEAQRLFLDIKNYKGAAECARNRANLYFQRGMYRHVTQYCEQALAWISNCNDHELRATILNTLAAAKSATGELKESLKVFNLCLSDFRAAGNSIRQGYVLLNIGLTQIELEDFNDAIQRLNDALSIALKEKDLHLVEICYQNISKCYLEQKETSLAKSVIDTARKFLPGLNSKSVEAELNLIDGKTLRLMGHYEAANELLEITLKMTNKLKLSALMADVLFEQGQVAREMGKFDMARAKIDTAAAQYKKIGMEKNFKQAVNQLNQLEKDLNALHHTTG